MSEKERKRIREVGEKESGREENKMKQEMILNITERRVGVYQFHMMHDAVCTYVNGMLCARGCRRVLNR